MICLKDIQISRDMTKPTKWLCAQRRLRSAWASALSDRSLCCPHKEKYMSLATHWAHSVDTDQTGRMPRLIWVFAGRTVITLVLSWGGSNHIYHLTRSVVIVFVFEYRIIRTWKRIIKNTDPSFRNISKPYHDYRTLFKLCYRDLYTDLFFAYFDCMSKILLSFVNYYAYI